MIAADSSVVIAGFASWHEFHKPSRMALDQEIRLPAHAALETYSVLTRLPPPHRATPDLVVEFLGARFSDDYLTLSAAGYRRLIESLPGQRLTGGAAYDALIAATAAEHRATLVTCDRRAIPTYEALDVRIDLVS